MEQDGDQGDPAPVVAPPGGGLPAPPPGPPMAEPLDDMGSIGAAVNAISNDKAPIITVLEGMAARMDRLAMENQLILTNCPIILTNCLGFSNYRFGSFLFNFPFCSDCI